VHGLGAFYFFYLLNALGYVCGGPLPNQVMLSGWFDAARGRAMGIAYLGIGVGGALVPLVANALTQALGWRGGLRALGAATIALLAFSPTLGMLQVAALLFGVGLGGDYMIIPLMAAELFGLRVLGRVMGIVLTADSVSESVVPMAVATLRDRLTSYRP